MSTDKKDSQTPGPGAVALRTEGIKAAPASTALVNYQLAQDVAGLCKELAEKTTVLIQKKRYLLVEGWTAIATAHGCSASARAVEKIPGGVRAIAEIRRISDGIVIAEAEGFVGEDEVDWYGGVKEYWHDRSNSYRTKTVQKRPEFAIRAMAQTRAISRVCRSVFSHVVVMMDKGLSTTPAEEVLDHDDRDDRQQEPIGTPVESLKPGETAGKIAEPAAKPEEKPIEVPRDAGNITEAERSIYTEGRWRKAVVHFGKNRGKELGQLEDSQIQWYAEEWQPKPYKGNWNPDDRSLRAALDVYCVEENLKARPRSDAGR